MLLATTHFTFLHMPKTGGSFVAHLCREHLQQEWLVRSALPTHARYDDIVAEFPDLPVLGFVRNPWDWYVSWYHYRIDHPPEGNVTPERFPMWFSAFGEGRNDFRQTVINACSAERARHRTSTLLMREHDIDHYSAQFMHAVGSGVDDPRLELGRFERLRKDFLAFLERHDVPVSEDFRRLAREAAPRNQSRRGPYREYYDAELRELVAHKARHLITRFGYEF